MRQTQTSPHHVLHQVQVLAVEHRKRQFPNTVGATRAKASRDNLLREKRKVFDQSLLALLEGAGLPMPPLVRELDRAWHEAFDEMTRKRALPFPLQGPIYREMSLEYYKLKTMWAAYVDSAQRIASATVEASAGGEAAS